MHEEEIDVAGVVDEEGLVARGHHVSGLLVRSISDLDICRIPSVPSPAVVLVPLVVKCRMDARAERYTSRHAPQHLPSSTLLIQGVNVPMA